jgi:hypothetical protein
LQRYLADQPVQASPPTLRYRFGKFARRNKTILATAAVVALTMLVTGGVSIWQARRAAQAELAAHNVGERVLAAEAKTKALNQIPDIEEHIRGQRFGQAFELLRQVEQVIPNDLRLDVLRHDCSWPMSIETQPPGVTVTRQSLDSDQGSSCATWRLSLEVRETGLCDRRKSHGRPPAGRRSRQAIHFRDAR